MQIYVFLLICAYLSSRKELFLQILIVQSCKLRFCSIKWWRTQSPWLSVCVKSRKMRAPHHMQIRWPDMSVSLNVFIVALRFDCRPCVSHRFNLSLVMTCDPSSIMFWQGHNVGQVHAHGRRAAEKWVSLRPVSTFKSPSCFRRWFKQGTFGAWMRSSGCDSSCRTRISAAPHAVLVLVLGTQTWFDPVTSAAEMVRNAAEGQPCILALIHSGLHDPASVF